MQAAFFAAPNVGDNGKILSTFFDLPGIANANSTNFSMLIRLTFWSLKFLKITNQIWTHWLFCWNQTGIFCWQKSFIKPCSSKNWSQFMTFRRFSPYPKMAESKLSLTVFQHGKLIINIHLKWLVSSKDSPKA